MAIVSQIIAAAMVAIFVENIIFTRGLGMSSMLFASKNRSELFGFGVIITFITTVSGLLTYFPSRAMKNDAVSYIYMPLIFVLIISVVYIITLLFLWKFMHRVFQAVRKYVHVSAFNCAVLGALFLNFYSRASIWSFAGYGLGTGIGFLLATYLVGIGYKKLHSDKIPEAFRGYPAMLIYVGILSMAFYGIAGYNINI